MAEPARASQARTRDHDRIAGKLVVSKTDVRDVEVRCRLSGMRGISGYINAL
jgi:hypothetical protein